MKTYPKKAKSSNRSPVAKIRDGRLTATVWERSNEGGTFYVTSFERSYQDAKGEWQTTQSFDVRDLLALAKLADQAHTRIRELEAEPVE